MTSPYWAKLWIEILDDPKVAGMPDWLFRRFIFFVLVAKEYDHDGLLQPVNDLAWRIRCSAQEATDALSALAKIGVTRETADGWLLINFVKRQEREYSDAPEAIRQRRYREKHHNEKSLQRNGNELRDTSVSVSTSSSESDSDSLLKDLNAQNQKSNIPSEVDVGRIFTDVTGMVFMPSGDHRGEYIESILQMLQFYGYDVTLERMKAAYNAWKGQHTKDGRPYSKTNLAWINYAMADEVPGGNGSHQKQKTVAEEIAEEIAHERQQIRY